MSAHKIDELSVAARRGRCVWWLSSQCTGGDSCQCVPTSDTIPRARGVDNDDDQSETEHPWPTTPNATQPMTCSPKGTSRSRASTRRRGIPKGH